MDKNAIYLLDKTGVEVKEILDAGYPWIDTRLFGGLFLYRWFYLHTLRSSVFFVCKVCLCTCLSPFHVIFFKASHWPCDHMISSRPLISQLPPPPKKKFAFAFFLLPKSPLSVATVVGKGRGVEQKKLIITQATKK